MKQGSDEWLLWRKKGLGSSDAAVIMGVSPYLTPYQLWLEKTGEAENNQDNDATWMGQVLEPEARDWYNLMHDHQMEPALFVHVNTEYLKASVDGHNSVIRKVLEIKYVGKQYFNEMKSGKGDIKDHHYAQMQHQLLVTGYDSVDYLVYNPECEGKGHVINVKRYEPYIKDLKRKLEDWWDKHIIGKKAPALTDKDTVEVTDRSQVSRFQELRRAKEEMDKWTKDYNMLKDQCILEMTHPNITCDGVSVKKGKRGVIFRFN